MRLINKAKEERWINIKVPKKINNNIVKGQNIYRQAAGGHLPPIKTEKRLLYYWVPARNT